MCGLIARFAHNTAPPMALADAMALIAHRGPDASGAVVWHQGGAPAPLAGNSPVIEGHVLAHQRLSILDLSSEADQPFRSSDGRFYIVYNGEIYNFIELREELRSAGIELRTSGDTEVLLEAWRVWGPACLSKLEGMFAFVLYDREQDRAFAARDPFGIKPLFLAETGDEVHIASEIQPIVAQLNELHFDPRSVAQSLRWGMNDGYAQTIVSGVRRLTPGTWIEIDPTSLAVSAEHTYFDFESISEEDWDFTEARDRLREAFLGSVERHLRSDAPLGFALSGGIDSSAIVCAAHALGRKDITTFSYIPHDERISERKWVDLVARQVGAKTHFISPSAEAAHANLRNVVRCQGETFASLSIYAQYEVYAEVARQDVKVILSGQGADELLAGYISYYQQAVATALRSGNFADAARRLHLLHDRFGQSYGSAAKWLSRLWLPSGLRDRLAKTHLQRIAPWLDVPAMQSAGMDCWASLHRDRGAEKDIRKMLIASMRHSLVALLRYDDRNSMAHSVESRVPFLTPELARLCLSFPDRFFIDPNGVTKYIFREAMREIVPQAILDRRDKIGFAPDLLTWRSAQRDIGSALGETTASGMVDRAAMRQALAEDTARGGTSDALLWRACNTIAIEQAYLPGSL